MKLFGLGKDPVEGLWEYVQKNIRSIDDIQKPAVQNGLTKALRSVNKELAWGCGASPSGAPVLEISADGLRHLIPVVKDLVNRAPNMPGISVVAFKQPSPPDFSLSTPFGDIDCESMRWSSLGTHDGLEGLAVYVPVPPSAPQDACGQIGFIFLDHTLGEYIVMTRVGELEFKPSSMAPADSRPFSELPGHFGMPPVS